MSEGPWIVLGLLLGVLAADGVTGAIHWACDSWGDRETRWLGPTLIRAFREHHEDPRSMLRHGWLEVNREPLAAASVVIVLLCLPISRSLLDGRVFVQAFLCGLLVFGAAANQLHQWAHSDSPPRVVAWAQGLGLILSPERHASHHREPNTEAYCISTGWLNVPLDAVGFWRALESAITWLTGAEPRRSEAGAPNETRSG